ncbi:MAG TPA: methyltransferase domain-containing protein [Caldimonas sp.]|jgi:SAM-dependent methyltransferase|nr:methyltransferase domain-containing protein [Caldimonas sp.]
MTPHASSVPSPWIERWAHLIAPGGTVLDVAAGSGRHTTWLAARGHAVTAVDRDAGAMAPLGGIAAVVVADLEGAPWPLAGRRFDAVVVTNYLWRPLLPVLTASLGDGGVLLYETFAAGNETVGRPARRDFLLAPGELLGAAAGLRIVAYEDGFLSDPERFVQRLAAIRAPAGAVAARYPLTPGAPAPGR